MEKKKEKFECFCNQEQKRGMFLEYFLSAGSLVVVKEPIEPLTSPFPYVLQLEAVLII